MIIILNPRVHSCCNEKLEKVFKRNGTYSSCHLWENHTTSEVSSEAGESHLLRLYSSWHASLFSGFNCIWAESATYCVAAV